MSDNLRRKAADIAYFGSKIAIDWMRDVHCAPMSTLLSTKADDIARVLEDEIVGGLIAPGTVLRQEQLSERFEVSRTPVREALRRLAALGLVSFEPNRGVRVRSVSPAELREALPRARRARGARDGGRDAADDRRPISRRSTPPSSGSRR